MTRAREDGRAGAAPRFFGPPPTGAQRAEADRLLGAAEPPIRGVVSFATGAGTSRNPFVARAIAAAAAEGRTISGLPLPEAGG